jgi:hypothetical protein
LPEAERGGAISGRLGNPSLALVPSNIQPTDTTSQTAPSSVLSIAKDGSSPHRMLHNAEGNAPTGCGPPFSATTLLKVSSQEAVPVSNLCTSCNWFGLLQQGGEVGWIIEGSLGGGGRGGGGGGVAFPALETRLGTGFDIRRGLAQFPGSLAG